MPAYLDINGSVLAVPFESIDKIVQVQTCDDIPELLFIIYRKEGQLPYVVDSRQGSAFKEEYIKWSNGS